jgi:CDP-glucose 4,6-dehydratase
MVVNSGFWKNKKVLVTGHTGFKGSWLCLWLQGLGANVVGYSLAPPSDPNLFEEANVAQGMTSLFGDIRDLGEMQKAIDNYKPEIVIHMAAQPLVRYSYNNPVETYSTNVMGTVNVLEAIRKCSNVRAVLVITTDKCYENKEWIWGYREDDPLGGHDPYSSSKACVELLISAYRKSYFNGDNNQIALASARAGNVIGGGDWAIDRLIPDMVRAVTECRPVHIRNRNAIRPWQHVLEPLSGYLLLAQKLYEEGTNFDEGWNFGPNDSDAKSVQWIVEKFIQQWGEDACWKVDNDIHPHEAHYLKLDCSKAKIRLNWQPKWSLEHALVRITAWHKAHQSGQNMRDFSLMQITEYQKEAIT